MTIHNVSQQEILKSEKAQTWLQTVKENFLQHRMALLSMVVIIFFIFVALLAPLIGRWAGLDPERQNALYRYQPMFSYVPLPSEERQTIVEQFKSENPTLIENANAFFNTDITTDLIYKDLSEVQNTLSNWKGSESAALQNLLKKMSVYHLCGTDELGRDVFIRLIYGSRVSMGVGILVAIVAAFIGLIIGSLAGFYGGWIDSLLMRVTDSLLSLPTMPVLIVVAAIDIDKLPWLRRLLSTGNENILKMVVLLCLFSWMQVARLVRANVLSLREREFILAAKTLGALDRTIIFRHLFPNTIAPLLVSVTLGVGNSIIYEASLSFLGLGIQQPIASWGNMLNNGIELVYQAPTLAILPGLLILLITISFNYMGDGLQDAVDPKSVRR